jgi:macrodomain Ter protein organizer (MatP/YcbG family)
MVYNWVRLSGEGKEKASEKSEKFVNMIQDPERRIYYAEKFQNYDIAMDVSDFIT